MIVDALHVGAWIPPLGGAPPVLSLLQGQDNPLGNLLGYVIVFMVVIWPIIRGVMDSAQEKRKEFERGQARQAKAKGRAGAPPARRTLEEILRGDPYVEALQEPTEINLDELREPRRTEASATRIPPASSGATGSGPHSRLEGANPALRPSERELVGDPFDDAIMGQDLVSDEDLQDVPSEDELETSMDTSAAGRGESLGAQGDRAAASEPKPREAVLSGNALHRIEGRLSPWQRAIVYREVLGPPACMHPHDHGRS